MQIKADNKVVIQDPSSEPTMAVVQEALGLAIQRGAPPEAHVKLQSGHPSGWAIIVTWSPKTPS